MSGLSSKSSGAAEVVSRMVPSDSPLDSGSSLYLRRSERGGECASGEDECGFFVGYVLFLQGCVFSSCGLSSSPSSFPWERGGAKVA